MKKIVCYCIMLLAIIAGCEQATSPGKDSEIYGTVLDLYGSPVADAKILVNFHIDSEYPIDKDGIRTFKGIDDPPWIETQLYDNYPNPFVTVTTIPFLLGTSCRVSLCIEDFDSNKIIDILEDDSLSAGSSIVSWDGKDNDNNTLQNGLYKVVLYTEGEIYTHTLFAFEDYNEFSYEDIAPLCVSDNSGKFTIQADDFPLDYVGDQYDEEGCLVGDVTITPYIDIWAFHPDYDAVHIDSILIESGKDVHVSLSLLSRVDYGKD